MSNKGESSEYVDPVQQGFVSTQPIFFNAAVILLKHYIPYIQTGHFWLTNRDSSSTKDHQYKHFILIQLDSNWMHQRTQMIVLYGESHYLLHNVFQACVHYLDANVVVSRDAL